MLTLEVLHRANMIRLPQFKDAHGRLAHAKPDGSDWNPAQWLQAMLGEVGEYANIRKKFERGDLTFEQYVPLASKELADIQTYFSILCARALDVVAKEGGWVVDPHPTGVDISAAVIQKFNEVSERVGADVFLTETGDIARRFSNERE